MKKKAKGIDQLLSEFKENKETVTTSFRIPKVLVDKLQSMVAKERAKGNKISTNRLIVRMIEKYLEE